MDRDQTLYAYNGVPHAIEFNASTNTPQTAVIGDHVTVVRVVSDQDVWVTFETKETDPETTGLKLKAGVIEYFRMSGAQKMNAQGVTASGTLDIAEMTT